MVASHALLLLGTECIAEARVHALAVLADPAIGAVLVSAAASARADGPLRVAAAGRVRSTHLRRLADVALRTGAARLAEHHLAEGVLSADAAHSARVDALAVATGRRGATV